MGSINKRLGNFLYQLLEEGESGIDWFNREELEFKIVWVNKKNKQLAHLESNIFRKWEIIKERLKEGEEPDKTKDLKQTFRGALKSSPDVVKIKELEIDQITYHVYQFTKFFITDKRTHSSTVKNFEGAVSLDNKAQNERGSYHQSIPTVVLENIVQMSNFSTRSVSPMTEVSSNNSQHAFSPFSGVDRCKSRSTISPFSETSTANKILSVSDYSNSINVTNNNELGFNFEQNGGQVLYNGFISSKETNNEFFDFDFDSYQTEFNSYTNNNNNFMLQKETRNYTSCLPVNNNDINVVRYQGYYSNVPIPQLHGFIPSNGVNIFYGKRPNANRFPLLYGPVNFDQVKLPSVEEVDNLLRLNGKSVVEVEAIQTILSYMERGLSLYYIQRKLFALRHCISRVYAWNKNEGSIQIDRKKKSEQQLFDMNFFEEQLSRYEQDPIKNVCPSPHIILSFGKDITDDKILNKDLFVHLELTYVEAEDLLKKQLPDLEGLQFSGFDSGDMLLEHFRSLKLQ